MAGAAEAIAAEDVEERLRALERQLQAIKRYLFDDDSLDEALPEGRLRVLCCEAGRERVAFLLRDVDEVVPRAALAALPDAPAWVLGLLSLRGATIPVLDVQARLSGAPSPRRLTDLILVVTRRGRTVGLLVQEVHGLAELEREEVHPPPRDVVAGPYLRGVLHVEDRPQLLLSVEKLLLASELLDLDDLDAPPGGAGADDDGPREPAPG